MKGDRRKTTVIAQKVRALAARIPDAAALDAISAAIPAGRQRESFLASIRPLLKFKTA